MTKDGFRVLPLLIALTGLLAGPGTSLAWAQMPDAERREMVKRVETAISEVGLYGAQTNDSGDPGWGVCETSGPDPCRRGEHLPACG